MKVSYFRTQLIQLKITLTPSCTHSGDLVGVALFGIEVWVTGASFWGERRRR